MPRPNRETLADKAVAMLEAGRAVPDIAAELGCSSTYVRVCRTRAELAKQGLRRSTKTRSGLAPALTPETRREMYERIGEKVSRTMRKHQGRAKAPDQFRAQQERARQLGEARDRWRAEERARKQKELDDMVASSIAVRRAHVNRILAAWRQEQ